MPHPIPPLGSTSPRLNEPGSVSIASGDGGGAGRNSVASVDHAVEVDGVSKNFDAIAALGSISLSVPRGEFVSLLGPSGCGKTTLLRIIAGLEQPSSGRMSIQGQRVDTLPPYLRNIGMVFQQYALFPHKSVLKNIDFGLRFRTSMGRTDRLDEIHRVLALVRLSGYEHRRPNQLSGGEQQRVALARAIVTRPAVLLLDEPLSNLDAKLRDEMRVELKDLHRALGITFLYVTHDRHEALAMSDRVVVMRAGHIEQVGVPAEVYERPATHHVARFMGHGNILSGRVTDSTASGLRLRLADGTELDARGPSELAPGTDVDLIVRGDSFLITSEPSGANAGGGSISATIRVVLYSGSFLDVHMNLADGTALRAELPNDGRADIREGAQVRLRVRQHGTWVLPRI